MAGRVELYRRARELPSLAQPCHGGRGISFFAQLGEEDVVETEAPLVRFAGPEKARLRQRGGGDPRRGSRARVQAFRPRAVEHRLHRAACERKRDALRALELLAVET